MLLFTNTIVTLMIYHTSVLVQHSFNWIVSIFRNNFVIASLLFSCTPRLRKTPLSQFTAILYLDLLETEVASRIILSFVVGNIVYLFWIHCYNDKYKTCYCRPKFRKVATLERRFPNSLV